jgi:hypothetical protein
MSCDALALFCAGLAGYAGSALHNTTEPSCNGMSDARSKQCMGTSRPLSSVSVMMMVSKIGCLVGRAFSKTIQIGNPLLVARPKGCQSTYFGTTFDSLGTKLSTRI